MSKFQRDQAARKVRTYMSRYVEVQDEEARGVLGALDQLDTLLADAQSRLASSFETIRELSARQHQVAGRGGATRLAASAETPAALEADSGVPAAVGACACSGYHVDHGTLNELAREVDRTLNEAATALQFHDIASQILQHARRRVELLERMSGQLEQLPEVPIEELAEVLERACAARGRNPVSQRRMAVGSVELF